MSDGLRFLSGDEANFFIPYARHLEGILGL